MKHIFLLIFLFFCAIVIKAQNLVPNPNFALYNACPTGLGQIEKCKYWYNPTFATSDYLNACHDTIAGTLHEVGVPTNGFGTQLSSSNAYIGIATFSGGIANSREYARTDISALITGAVYRVLIKVSASDNSYYATYAPSIFFYKDRDSLTPSNWPLPYTPQIMYSTAGHITDMANWTTLIDTFTADSAYTHLIIGNFNGDATTSKIIMPGTVLAGGGSYFYIDSISVEKIADPSFVNNVAETKNVSIFPNPNAGSFTLQLPGEESHVTITDITGRKVKEFNANATIHIQTNVAQGVYFLEVVTGAEKWTGKWVVTR